MARDFAAGTNRITSAVTTTLSGSPVSYAIWARRESDGGSSLGRMFHTVTGAEGVYINGTNYRFLADWAGTDGQWGFTKPSTNVWAHIGVSYDDSSTSNDPLMYLDGASQTISEFNAPTSTRTTIGQPVMGNHATLDRGWDGQLAEYAVWNRILTDAEFAALGKGFSPLFFPNGLIEYIPMLRDNVSYKGGAPTVSGTTVYDHPRIIYPAPMANRRYTTAAGGGGATRRYSLSLSGIG